LRAPNCSKQILLIDPDEVFCQVLQQVLGSGYSLRRVSTAKAGVDQLDSAEVDVVLLNLDLQNGAASSEDILALVKLPRKCFALIASQDFSGIANRWSG
jgi:CheY-like chemotaxis protein